MTELRRDLPPLPRHFRRLPIDARGYPVPFFVAYVDGVPDFRVADQAKHRRCVKEKLCWLCGTVLGRYVTFLIGPMCAVNRLSSEPPAHLECADFAARACPFMVRPKARRREANLPDNKIAPAGIPIARNPGVVLTWTTRDFTTERYPEGLLYRLGDPVNMKFYAEGRQATPAEIHESIDSGLPLLRQAAEQDGEDGLKALEEHLARAMRLLPPRPAAA